MPLAHTPEKCATYNKPRKINAHIARTPSGSGFMRGEAIFQCVKYSQKLFIHM